LGVVTLLLRHAQVVTQDRQTRIMDVMASAPNNRNNHAKKFQGPTTMIFTMMATVLPLQM
jgi:hypothetical protein